MSAQDRATGPGAIKRRSFIDIVLGVGFVSTALSFLYPLFRYAIPPIAAEPATDSVIAGKITEFKTNSGVVLKFGSKPAILVRTTDGAVPRVLRRLLAPRLHGAVQGRHVADLVRLPQRDLRPVGTGRLRAAAAAARERSP